MSATVSQHKVALERANAVRTARAALRRDLRAGRVTIREVDLDDEVLQGMKVLDLVASLPWRRDAGIRIVQGREFVSKPRRGPALLMSRLGMQPGLTIGALSEARRRQLVNGVISGCPTQREAAIA